MKYALDKPEISLKYGWDMDRPEKGLKGIKYAWDMDDIGLKYGWVLLEICLGYFWYIPHV